MARGRGEKSSLSLPTFANNSLIVQKQVLIVNILGRNNKVSLKFGGAWGEVVEAGGRAGPDSRGKSSGAAHLHLLHLVRHVVQPQVLSQARGVQGVRVGQQQVRAAVGIPAGAHGATLQAGEVG